MGGKLIAAALILNKMGEMDKEKELNDLVEDKPTKVKLGKGYVNISWPRGGTLRKITDIYLNEKKDLKYEQQVTCKVAAALVLNNFFLLKLFHWFLWRWYFYIKEYSDKDLKMVIEEGKKKVELDSYYMNMILVIGLRDTIQAMTREEVSRFHRELLSEQKGS